MKAGVEMTRKIKREITEAIKTLSIYENITRLDRPHRKTKNMPRDLFLFLKIGCNIFPPFCLDLE
jgi:hypothetical protein